MESDDDTIFALSTAPGRAALAVIRISGPGVTKVGDALNFRMPPPRVAALRKLRDRDRVLDQALVLFFESPGSYTGEDVLELHIHGGRAVYDSVISLLGEQERWRFALPGEFSRRAVLNGRLDLTRAEAVNDLVNAETDAQRELALGQLEGGLGRQFDAWAQSLLAVRAHLEAYIDFPDEEIPEATVEALIIELRLIGGSMADFLEDDRRGERLRSGMRIAVVGPPNVGKSSFVNWLAERDLAIVSEEPGTTRDLLEAHLDLGGFPVIVADTAGLRSRGEAVEIEGMRRARAWARDADWRILMVDASTLGEVDVDGFGLVRGDVVMANKIDLLSHKEVGVVAGQVGEFECLGVSVAEGGGLKESLARITAEAKNCMGLSGGPVISRARHRTALARCIQSVERALDGFESQMELEIVAEDLRLGSDDLGRVTGRVDVEDLLDLVFRDFCIGK
jgi:tRNA modification GTPase